MGPQWSNSDKDGASRHADEVIHYHCAGMMITKEEEALLVIGSAIDELWGSSTTERNWHTFMSCVVNNTNSQHNLWSQSKIRNPLFQVVAWQPKTLMDQLQWAVSQWEVVPG